ncbi:hypothetical protein D3C76_1091720 [compost metagenome]
MDNDNRQLGRNLVKIICVGMALLHQLRVVIAKSDNPANLIDSDSVFLLPAFQRSYHRWNGFAPAIRRWQQVSGQFLKARCPGMAMRINESRKKYLTFQIHKATVISLTLQDISLVSDRQNLSVLHGNRLSIGWIITFHGQDRAAEIDGVCDLSSRLCSAEAAERKAEYQHPNGCPLKCNAFFRHFSRMIFFQLDALHRSFPRWR